MNYKKPKEVCDAIAINSKTTRMLLLAAMVCLFVFGSYSCRFIGGDKDRNCRSIMPVEQMAEILHDLYLMEGYILTNLNLQVDDTLDYYFAGVFSKHKISYAQFKKAIDCYLFNKSDMDFIHEKILEKFSAREEQVLKDGLILQSVEDDFTFRKHPDCFLYDVCY